VVIACGDDQHDYKIMALEGSGLAEVAALPSDGFVRDIDVSADRRVAVLGHDRRLRVWDLASRELLCESVRDLDGRRIAFDENHGQDYVVAGEASTGAVGRFPVRPDLLQGQARQLADRELTAEELAGLEEPYA
jgi:hypothetical protein